MLSVSCKLSYIHTSLALYAICSSPNLRLRKQVETASTASAALSQFEVDLLNYRARLLTIMLIFMFKSMPRFMLMIMLHKMTLRYER